MLTLLLGVLLTSGSLLLSGGGLLAQPQEPSQSYARVVESFDQIVPGMTRADDLPNLGFGAPTANADILSYRDIQQRFLPAGAQWEHLEPAVRACIRAELYCNGFVFHAAASTRIGKAVSDLLGLARIRQSSPTAEVVLLVMNGRVVHKVFSPRTDTIDDRRKPLAPLQDGGAMARADANATTF
ncbi:hypothetical protein AYO42_02215 [Rhizomicrobium sp. SCGC AG-212-E05]|nr:hypothetical protein AYO42_02215 [Rhizomicrobium sp. SCGC AG-212-E05]